MGNAVSPSVASALGRCLALAAVGDVPGDLDHAVVAVPDPVLHEVRFLTNNQPQVMHMSVWFLGRRHVQLS